MINFQIKELSKILIIYSQHLLNLALELVV